MKKIFLLIAITSLLIAACNTKTADSSAKGSSPASLNPANFSQVEYDVAGMTCTGCENTVKSGVSSLSGVAEVNASFLEGKVLVTFDTTLVSTSDIGAEIGKKGYKVNATTQKTKE